MRKFWRRWCLLVIVNSVNSTESYLKTVIMASFIHTHIRPQFKRISLQCTQTHREGVSTLRPATDRGPSDRPGRCGGILGDQVTVGLLRPAPLPHSQGPQKQTQGTVGAALLGSRPTPRPGYPFPSQGLLLGSRGWDGALRSPWKPLSPAQQPGRVARSRGHRGQGAGRTAPAAQWPAHTDRLILGQTAGTTGRWSQACRVPGSEVGSLST